MTHASKPSMSMCASVEDYQKLESQYLETQARAQFITEVGPRETRPEIDAVLAQSTALADALELHNRQRWDLRFYDYLLGFVSGYIAHEES